MLESLFLEESMQPEMQRLPSETEMTSAAMEGYEACTEEAIRYLIEEENVPADDPMVIGLREYLFQQQKALSYRNLLDIQLPVVPNTSLPQLFNSFDGCNDYSLRGDNISDQSSDCMNVSTNMSSDDSMTSEVDMTESVDAFDVSNLCLSHEKLSAIRSLTEELLSLMEEEDEFYSDDDEEGDYDYDVEDDVMTCDKESDK